MTGDADWQPLADSAALKRRAAMLETARRFFATHNVLEVETPVLTGAGVTDAGIRSLATTVSGNQIWLRTSPEYHMKRLLAAGSGDIYQIAKVFRDGEAGNHHQPEFTMAEWYRLNFTLEQIIDETCSFIVTLMRAIAPAEQYLGKANVHCYRDVVMAAVQLDPLTASLQKLQNCASGLPGWHGSLGHQLGRDRNNWLDFIVSHAVFPQLPSGGLQVIRDFPAEQAMLARRNPDNPEVAERFEIFLHGMELANGFRELADPEEQQQRFAKDNVRRVANGQPAMAVDTRLLAALTHGLPDCSGVAVGLDRVLMLAGGYIDISATLSFRPGS